jgi:hypothetical protein
MKRSEISGIIQSEFFKFMRENPDWYIDVDWNYWASENRFTLQSNRAAIAIEKYLENGKK